MSEPLYRQIENYIKDLISTGEVKEGELVPSEKELCDKFGVTRMTAGKALTNLASEGYVTRKRGVGSIVLAKRIYDDISAVTGFTEEMTRKGYKVSNVLVSLKVVEADEELVKKLAIEEGEMVWEIKRVRVANDIKVSYMVTYMPVKLFPSITKTNCNKSLYQFVEEECGYKIAISEREMQAIISTEELEEHLELEESAPILYIREVGKLKDSRPFEYSHTYHHGYTLTINAVSK